MEENKKQANIFKKKEAGITRIKSMADGSYRTELDLQELTGTELGELEDLRKEGLVGVIICSTEILNELEEMLKLVQE